MAKRAAVKPRKKSSSRTASSRATSRRRAARVASAAPGLRIGVDVEHVARVGKLLASHPERFLERVFTVGEQAHSGAGRLRVQRLTARFAAKEAVMKALGTGLSAGVRWTDIEVVTHASGKPAIQLRGHAATVATTAGITAWEVSLSHTRELAVAVVVGW